MRGGECQHFSAYFLPLVRPYFSHCVQAMAKISKSFGNRRAAKFPPLVSGGHWACANAPARDRSCLDQIEHIFKWQALSRKNGAPLSERSRIDYRTRVLVPYQLLRQHGFAIKNVWSIEERHISFLVRHWVVDSVLSASMVQNYLSVLSWWGSLMAKPNLVKPLAEYAHLFDGRDVTRSQVASYDHSEVGAGVLLDDLFARALAVDEAFFHILQLQRYLGLRRREALSACPLRDDLGSHYQINARDGGSKGRRARVIVLFRSDEPQGKCQRDALEAAKQFLLRQGATTRSRLGWSGWHDQARTARTRGIAGDISRYKDLAERIGLTKQALGMTGHGLRHGYAHDRLLHAGFISALRSPSQDLLRADGAVADQTDQQRLTVAALQTSESMGHSRADITRAYCGPLHLPGATHPSRTNPVAVNSDGASLTARFDTPKNAGHACPPVTTRPRNQLTPAARRASETQFEASSITVLRSIGFAVKEAAQFRPKHIEALIGLWRAGSNADPTVSNKLIMLRRMCAAAGKPGLVLANDHYDVRLQREKGAAATTRVAERPLAPDEFARALSVGQVFAHLLLLQRATGAHAEQIMRTRPWRDHEADVYVFRAEGQKAVARVIPVDDQLLRVIETVKQFVLSFHGKLAACLGYNGSYAGANKQRLSADIAKYRNDLRRHI